MPHAVVLQVTLADSGRSEEGLKMLREMVIPQAKAQDGFLRGTWMNDGNNGLGVVLFDTEAQAVAAKEVLKPPPGGPTLVSAAVYEVGAEA